MGYQVKINQLFLKQYRFAFSIYLLGFNLSGLDRV